jgi:hypothetical protein
MILNVQHAYVHARKFFSTLQNLVWGNVFRVMLFILEAIVAGLHYLLD